MAALAAPAGAAETADPTPMGATSVVIKVGATEPVPVETRFQPSPPTIIVSFPPRRVLGSLPEQSPVAKSVIQSIGTRYDGRRTFAHGSRFIEELRIALSGPYPYRVYSEAGQIRVEIDHPVTIRSAAVEVGLSGGTVISGLRRATISERFRAMQDAMASAMPVPWSMNIESPAPAQPAPGAAPATAISAGAGAAPSEPGSGPAAPSGTAPRPSIWLIAALAASLFGLIAWRSGAFESFGRPAAEARYARLPSGVVFIDQLVWRAFERQGYQLVLENELTQAPWGTLRIAMKDGAKTGLLFVGSGPFFEKQTVERFLQVLRAAGVDRGILVASGSFTVPAQRIAKEQGITLIGREQLTELLSAGAGSEYFAQQLEQNHARLAEARETLQQYATELDTLRRQRNEASWYLGEERTKTAKLEAQIEELQQQVRRAEGEVQQMEQQAGQLRRQWEESQWYLGESRERARQLQEQAASSEEQAQRFEAVERERDEALQQLEALRASHAALERELTDLRRQAEAPREETDPLRAEPGPVRPARERRRGSRGTPEVAVELSSNGADAPFFIGSPRDLSKSGLGLELTMPFPEKETVRARLIFPARAPIASRARLVWQQEVTDNGARFRSGCRLVGLPARARAMIEELVEQSSSTSTS
jgi:hypothetical protein